jgi:hypothetical protein
MRGSFQLPTYEELIDLGPEERLNVFRRFFAFSRYGRLIIQQHLVKSAIDDKLIDDVIEMERLHNQNLEDIVKEVTKYGFLDEFRIAVKEEDAALQKILEAYDKRMEGRF